VLLLITAESLLRRNLSMMGLVMNGAALVDGSDAAQPAAG
jgi:hypothetical protein